jgi:FixJ family two-component response regulator
MPTGVAFLRNEPGVLRGIRSTAAAARLRHCLFESAEAFENHTDFTEALCVLIDINLNNGRSGIELRDRIKKVGHAVPVIYMTGNDNPAVHKAALESGCLAYLFKPVSARSLLGPLERASALWEATI